MDLRLGRVGSSFISPDQPIPGPTNQQGDAASMQATSTITTMKPPLTPQGAAEYLGLDVKTVTRWARQGYLPAHPLGEGKRTFWRFFENELSDWLAAKTNQQEAA